MPKRECYCAIGWFGRNCETRSDLGVKAVNESLYNVERLRGDSFKFMWRVIGPLEETLEGVIVAKTTSYVAIGWRSSEESPSCQMFPRDVEKPPVIPKQLHGMDCQDIIIGKANGDLSNVGDYYTRDRSTPRRDDIYGGKDDLSAAAGWEEDGVTTIMFRRPVNPPDMTDNAFENNLHMIFAYGQASADFYMEDELKYHSGNRGLKGNVA